MLELPLTVRRSLPRIAKEEKETKVKWFGVYKELCHARDTGRELAASVVEDLKVRADDIVTSLVRHWSADDG